MTTCTLGCPSRAKGRGLCHACYSRVQRHGRLEEWPVSRVTRPIAEVLEDLDLLVETGVVPANWPSRLGMSPAALERALYRAGRNEQAREVSRVRREVERVET